MLVTLYKCPHCKKLFDDRKQYRKHALEVMQDSADILNSFRKDLTELHISICVNYSPLYNESYVEVKTDVDQSN